MSSSILFVDVFELRELDMVEKKGAKSESYDTEVTLDFNSQIFPLHEGDKFELALSRTLSRTGAPDLGEYEAPADDGSSLLDDYDYVMHGKIFKYAEDSGKAIIYISFGGLLMALKGEPRTLPPTSFEVGDDLYLLVKKFSSS